MSIIQGPGSRAVQFVEYKVSLPTTPTVLTDIVVSPALGGLPMIRGGALLVTLCILGHERMGFMERKGLGRGFGVLGTSV